MKVLLTIALTVSVGFNLYLADSSSTYKAKYISKAYKAQQLKKSNTIIRDYNFRIESENFNLRENLRLLK